MKKNIIIIFIILFAGTTVFGQGRKNSFFTDEYNYVSIKIGLSHSFLDRQPDAFQYKFVESPRGNMKIDPVDKYFAYTGSYLAGLTFTHDFKNINSGVIIGAIYENFGISSKYQVAPEFADYTVVEKNIVNTISIPLYLKFGYKYFKKDFYLNMQYFYGGINYNLNRGITRIEKVSWNETESFKSSLEKAHKSSNTGLVMGYNRGFGNIEIKYVFGGFFARNNDVSLYNGTKEVKPYDVMPKGILYLTTNFVVPANVWTKRKSYMITQTLRKVFGGN